MMGLSGRDPGGSGSRASHRAASVSTLPGFDPSRCQWCNEDGFDLRGLAHHVWSRCEVVERLAEENVEDVRRSNEAFHAAAVRRQAIAMEAASAGETAGLDPQDDSAGLKGIAR